MQLYTALINKNVDVNAARYTLFFSMDKVSKDIGLEFRILRTKLGLRFVEKIVSQFTIYVATKEILKENQLFFLQS